MKPYLLLLFLFAFLLPACTPTPTATPAPPTITPTVTECPWELVLPTIIEMEPESVSPGDQFKLIASGGYLRDTCGGVNESARNFDVYLDDQVIGQIVCYVNYCQGELVLPAETEAGNHCLAFEPDACGLEIEVK